MLPTWSLIPLLRVVLIERVAMRLGRLSARLSQDVVKGIAVLPRHGDMHKRVAGKGDAMHQGTDFWTCGG